MIRAETKPRDTLNITVPKIQTMVFFIIVENSSRENILRKLYSPLKDVSKEGRATAEKEKRIVRKIGTIIIKIIIIAAGITNSIPIRAFFPKRVEEKIPPDLLWNFPDCSP
jgi:hypothetical protein